MIAAARDAIDTATTARGYHVEYRENEVNHCPGCGRTHWYVGRLSAECAFCTTALPIMETRVGTPAFRTRKEVRLYDE